MGCGASAARSQPKIKRSELPPSARVQLNPSRPPTRGVAAGVQVGWLKRFAQERCVGMSTQDVVNQIIVADTRARKCRYVALLEEQSLFNVGRARCFVSHTKRMPFCTLAAAISHVLPDDEYVWIDIFAVLQHSTPDQAADLDFKAVVNAVDFFLLAAVHLEEVAQMSWDDAFAHRVPESALKLCPFYSVWCISQLVSALLAGKPRVLLVGGEEGGRFIPNADMLPKLFHALDIAHSAATEEARAIAKVMKWKEQDAAGAVLHAVAPLTIEAVNLKFRALLGGAMACMYEREVLAAQVGHPELLAALREQRRLESALRAAAAGGFELPLETLLQRRELLQLDACDDNECTALMLAARDGHKSAVETLINAGAQVDWKTAKGITALMYAADGGHTAVVELMMASGADTTIADENGVTALMYAAKSQHRMAASALMGHQGLSGLSSGGGLSGMGSLGGAGAALAMESDAALASV